MKQRLIVIALLLGLFAMLALGLRKDPHEIPSPFIGKAAPDFRRPLLADPQRSFSPADLKGQVWLLNVWASWCSACREEHPALLELARRRVLPVVGLDYKDETAAAKEWLQQQGNPYGTVVVDPDGRVGIDWGVYGVPETFLIDRQGVVRYKHTGPLTTDVLETRLLPLIAELNKP